MDASHMWTMGTLVGLLKRAGKEYDIDIVPIMSEDNGNYTNKAHVIVGRRRYVMEVSRDEERPFQEDFPDE